MAATTLLGLATDRNTAAQDAAKTTRTAAANAQTALSAARKKQQDTVADFAKLDADVAAIRRQLAEVPTAADGDALVEQLGLKLIALRAKSAELLAAEAALAISQAASDVATADAQAAESAAAAASAALDSAKAQDDRRNKNEAKLAAAPLNTIAKDGDDAMNAPLKNATFLAAKKRIEDDIPAKLIERARKRRESSRAYLARVDSKSLALSGLVETQISGAEGNAGKIEAARRAYMRAEADVDDLIANSFTRFQAALNLLSSVADKSNSTLTAAQTAAIAAGAVKGEPAADAEKARDEKQDALDAAQAALDNALIAAQAADIDKASALEADPSSDATLAPLVTARDKAITERDDKESLYTAALKTDLNTWEAAVPEPTWKLLAAFEQARTMLKNLAGADSTALKTKRDNAEKALVNALLAADKAARTRAFLRDLQAVEDAVLQFETANASRRVMAALRGDL